MLKVKKNNKRLEECIAEVIANIKESFNNEFYDYVDNMATPERINKLEEYYHNIGLTDYKVQVSHTKISDMEYNKVVDLSFMKKSSNYKPLKISKRKFEPANYAVANEKLRAYYPLVVLDEDIEVPMICEDNLGWMAPVLFEEETMKKSVEKAHGNVLTFGLGIGFFQFNCLLKDDVKEVTVIEKNKEIISLFRKYILPQFPNKNIKIIEGDAFEYFNDDFVSKYDFTFVDIWRNNGDGIFIISKLLKNIDLSKDYPLDFWIEDSILYDIQTSLAIYIKYLYEGTLNKFLGESIAEEDDENFITFDKLHSFFKKRQITINNKNDFINILNDKKILREILKSL